MYKLLLAAALPASLLALPSYSVQLATVAGSASSTAQSINNSGVVTGTLVTSSGKYSGYQWNQGAAMTLAGMPGSLQTFAAAINNNGSIAGHMDTSAGPVAVIWGPGGPALVGGETMYALGINDSGATAGTTLVGGGGHASYVANGGTVMDLGTLGGDWSSAYDVNNSGIVVGSSMLANGNFRGFVWNSFLGMQELSTLGGVNSHAMAVNEAGTITGSASVSSGYSNAAVWQNGFVIGLGTLGGNNSYGYGINSAGAVVGYSDTADLTAAFLYQNGVMRNLNSLIGAGSGWQLLAAYGINDLGQIVGRGLYEGKEQGFLLTPQFAAFALSQAPAAVPEPGTLGLFALSALAIVVFRKR